ncbi:RHS repeat domain-containing protein [Pseudomonas sp. Z3-8]|uniref:RHS repeat domain-containing protein n=1 Tax=Pseudomonas sp. Z3-8 TaxID=2817412 RepID=UPI003DA8E92B
MFKFLASLNKRFMPEKNMVDLEPPTAVGVLPPIPGGEENLLPKDAWQWPLRIEFPLWSDAAPKDGKYDTVELIWDENEAEPVATKRWEGPLEPDSPPADLWLEVPVAKLDEGIHRVYYQLHPWNSSTPRRSVPIKVTIDKTPPQLAFNNVVLIDPTIVEDGLSQQYLIDNNGIVAVSVPTYLEPAPGDRIVCAWKNEDNGQQREVSRTLTKDDYEEFQFQLEFDEALIRDMGDGPRSISYRVFDRAGNESPETTEELLVGANPKRSVTRIFNRFHLLVSQTTLQGTHQQILSNRYYVDDDPKAPFDQQPRQCQLLKEATTRWELTDDPRVLREDVELSEYDIHGNQTLSVQASGVTETTTYYPAEGVVGQCPKDPYGFVRHVEQTTTTPTTDPLRVPDVQAGAPTLRTRYRYIELPTLAKSDIKEPWAVVAEQALYQVDQADVLLETTRSGYFDTPLDPLIHGLIQLETVERVGADQSYVSTTGYQYSIKTDEEKARKNKTDKASEVLLGETAFATTETFTGHDSLVKVVSTERSLLNGEPLLSQDKDIRIRNTYDALLRVVMETVAPDDPVYAATRSYIYRLVRPSDSGQALAAGQAWQEMENVKKVKTRTWFDGLNRPVSEEQQDFDFSAGEYRETYRATHNALGQLTEEHEIDWLELEPLVLKTTYTFDDWGEQSRSTDAAGVTQHTLQDPIMFTSTEWTQGMGKTVTTTNRLEKPVKVERFDLAQASVSVHGYSYDGLGRTALEKNAAGYETSYVYDVFDRMLETTLPTQDKVVREYAGHSRGDLPTLIKVNDKVLGTQAFDSLERLVESTTGGRVTRHEYDTSYTKANRVIQPSGDVIHYEYAYELTDEPLTRKAVAGEATIQRLQEVPAPIEAIYGYDFQDARLLNSSETDIQLERTYDVRGEIKTETRKVTDVVDPYAMTYVHSRLGRIIRYYDVIGQVQLSEYDRTTGKLAYTELGVPGTGGYVRSDFTYNVQGLTERISTVDGSNNKVSIQLEYDALGRETLRTFDFNGARSWLKQVWNNLDQVEQRELSEGSAPGETLLRDENYRYELRGRLEEYWCDGPQSPVDPYGNVISEQVFFFDALDNHEEVRTTFIKGSATEINKAQFEYTGEDPTQLTAVVNSHVDYPDITLEYDANGNLIKDEEGRALSYDLLSRLVEVSGPSPSN